MSQSALASLDAEIVRPILLVELNFRTQALRLTSGPTDVSWNGHAFIANGWVLPVDNIQESTDIGKYDFDLTLSGVSLALLSLILSNDQRDGIGVVWLGLMTENGSLVASPITLFRGNIDSSQIDDKIENPTVTISLTNELSRLDTSQNFRFTNESQIALYPGDKGFEYVTKLESWSGFWGKSERPKWLKKPKARKR